WWIVVFYVGLYATTPILFSSPEPSVYIDTVAAFLCSCFLLYRSLAVSFVALIWISTFGIHHGGRMYGWILSIFSGMCRNWCITFSRLDQCLTCAVLTSAAFVIHAWSGC